MYPQGPKSEGTQETISYPKKSLVGNSHWSFRDKELTCLLREATLLWNSSHCWVFVVKSRFALLFKPWPSLCARCNLFPLIFQLLILLFAKLSISSMYVKGPLN